MQRLRQARAVAAGMALRAACAFGLPAALVAAGCGAAVPVPPPLPASAGRALPEMAVGGASIEALQSRLVALAADRPRLEHQARLVLQHHPELALAHHALALVALERGEHERALASARRALGLDPGLGCALRLVRRLLVAEDRGAEAVATWQRGLFAPELAPRWPDRFAARRQALAAAATTVARRADDPEARHALARAYLACGWIEEAALQAARLDRIDRELERQLRLVRAVRRGLAALGPQHGLEEAQRVLAAAAVHAGRPELAGPPLATSGGEAGTLLTPGAPLVAALLEAGVLLELRETSRGLLARAPSVVALFEVPALTGTAPVLCYVVEGQGLEPARRQALLGRSGPAGAVVLDLDALRPAPRDLACAAALLAGQAPRSAAERALLRLLERLFGPPPVGVPRERLFAELLAVRLDYVALHEVGHAVDLRRLVPRAAHPWRNLERLFAGGLSAAGIGARDEEVAELFALLQGRWPAAALYSLLGAAAHGGPSVHARAARAVLAGLAAAPEEAAPVRAEEIARRVLLLDDPELRARARARLVALGVLEPESRAP
ncbi:MAG: hypothetical protein KatS3mg102_1777 [Planctomycetota bacterium]|nr:MAG: hypothetical protein KatS3mg102_1777 [Planctomycetota bacterium]